jgi:hypothetical protein
MAKISYAIVALRLHEVETVIDALQAKKLTRLIQWLQDNKNAVYGATAENWKPFNSKTIHQLLNEEDDSYKSETHLIEQLDDDCSNLGILVKSGIEIYFVDVLALFFGRYRKIAERLDWGLAEGTRKWCVVMPNGLSEEALAVMSNYGNVCAAVTEAYLRGNSHPVIFRADDLMHVRNNLLMLLGDRPDPNAARQMDDRYGRGSKPQL